MGNAVVIPSFHDWYTQPLKKLKISINSHIDAGTFFMVFEGKSNDNPKDELIIKAYEYNEPLANLSEIAASQKYFQTLADHSSEVKGIQNYNVISIQDNIVFLVRPKFNQKSLIEFATFQQPELDITEKLFIFYQLYVKLQCLHSIGLAHGDLKPSNVFVDSSLEVIITDPAPFKLKMIHPSKKHLFYHYFAMNSNSGCYLAPERLFDDNPEHYNSTQNTNQTPTNGNSSKSKKKKSKSKSRSRANTTNYVNTNADNDPTRNKNDQVNREELDLSKNNQSDSYLVTDADKINNEKLLEKSKDYNNINFSNKRSSFNYNHNYDDNNENNDNVDANNDDIYNVENNNDFNKNNEEIKNINDNNIGTTNIDGNKNDKNNFFEVDLMMSDVFSLGCIAAFLFMNGRDLFDLDTLDQYYKSSKISSDHQNPATKVYEHDQNKIDEILNKSIPDKSIIDMIKGLIEIDIEKRKKAFEKLPSFFDSFFDIFLNMCYEYKSEQLFIRDPQRIMPSLIDLITKHYQGGKIIVYDFFSDQVLKMNLCSNITFCVGQISNFSTLFSDDFKLMRIIPLFITLADVKMPIILRECIFSIYYVFRTIKEIPKYLDNVYFEYYIKVEFRDICSRCTDERSFIALAEFLPLFGNEINRLSPKDLNSSTIVFSSIFGCNKIHVFQTFSNSMIRIAKSRICFEHSFNDYSGINRASNNTENSVTSVNLSNSNSENDSVTKFKDDYVNGNYNLLSSFLYFILSAFNYPNVMFRVEGLRIILEFYKNSAKGDRRSFIIQCNESILPICSDIIGRRNSDEELLESMFEFLTWTVENKFIDVSYGYDFYEIAYEYMYSEEFKEIITKNNYLRYWLNRFIKTFPKDIQNFCFYHFIFEGKKVQQNLINNYSPPIKTFTSVKKLSDPNQLPLIPNDKIKSKEFQFKPKYINSFHIGNSKPISHIISTPSNNVCILIDRANKIRWITYPTLASNNNNNNNKENKENKENIENKDSSFNIVRSLVSRNHIISSLSLNPLASFVLGYDNGSIDYIDLITSRKTNLISSTASSRSNNQISDNENMSILAMAPLNHSVSNNTIIYGTKGKISLLDMREKNNHNNNHVFLNYSYISDITDICTWPSNNNNNNMVGVGFKEGVVSLLDMRMNLPFWLTQTESVDQIIPISSDSVGSSCFLVLSDNKFCVYKEPQNKILLSQYEEKVRFVLPFKGGAIALDDKSASFVSILKSYRLYDGYVSNLRFLNPPIRRLNASSSSTFSMIASSNSSVSLNPQNAIQKALEINDYNYSSLSSNRNWPSVHQHCGEIICASLLRDDNIISCDNLGFVNLWSLTDNLK